MSDEEYCEERIADFGEFMGNVNAGIYEGIRIGAANNESHFAFASGGAHQSWRDYFGGLKAEAT